MKVHRLNKSIVDSLRSMGKSKEPWTMDCGLWTNKGFTLIEVLVVMVILGFIVAMAAQVFMKDDDQRRFDETRIRMEEIKKAILGSEGAYANGQRQFAGYVADMGVLPVLSDIAGTVDPTDTAAPIREIQRTYGLWNRGALTAWAYENQGLGSRIWCGWRGPYIETPPGDILKDGWGNPFIIFRDSLPVDICGDISAKITAMGGMQPGDMAIISLGADNACGETDIFDEDIIIIVRQTEYEAPVAGRIKFPFGYVASITTVTLYSSIGGFETALNPAPVGGHQLDANGYFRFEPRDSATEPPAELAGRKYANIAVGLRCLHIADSVYGNTQQLFTVEPTGNWLGDIEIQ